MRKKKNPGGNRGEGREKAFALNVSYLAAPSVVNARVCFLCGYFRKRRRVFCLFTGETVKPGNLGCSFFALPWEVGA
jgi:hypothetical protein